MDTDAALQGEALTLLSPKEGDSRGPCCSECTVACLPWLGDEVGVQSGTRLAGAQQGWGAGLTVPIAPCHSPKTEVPVPVCGILPGWQCPCWGQFLCGRAGRWHLKQGGHKPCQSL